MLQDIKERLKEDIIQQSELEKEQIQKEIDIMHKEVIETYKQGLSKETSTFLETELKDLKLKEVTLGSKYKLKAQKDLRILRDKLVEELFLELKEELKKFAVGKKYKEFLEKKIKELNIEGGTIKCLEKDIEVLKALVGDKKVAFESIDLELGGFIYQNDDKNLIYDLSLDDSYRNQISYFRNNSKFLL